MQHPLLFAACICLSLFATRASAADTTDLVPVRIGQPVNGHIHPAMCLSKQGTLIVTFGQVNHVDLRITRSTDGGKTWSPPTPFIHTVNKTYYPGSLTTLASGDILHCWNRWSEENNQKEPRHVEYSLSSDDGLTWSEPKKVPHGTKSSVIRHPIVELAPDAWLMPLWDQTIVYHSQTGSVEPFGDGRLHGLTPLVRTAKGTFVSGLGVRSTDGGKTWQEIKDMPDVKSQGWRHEMAALPGGLVVASRILGPGFGGESIEYSISRDDGVTWSDRFEYYNPGRAINGRACPRTVQLDEAHLGVVFYDIDKDQPGGPGLFFLKIPLAKLK